MAHRALPALVPASLCLRAKGPECSAGPVARPEEFSGEFLDCEKPSIPGPTPFYTHKHKLTGFNRTWVSADLSARRTFGWPKVRFNPSPTIFGDVGFGGGGGGGGG